MKISELRNNDPVIQDILQHIREVNVQEPEYSALKKILIEGVDGRYNKEACDCDFICQCGS